MSGTAALEKYAKRFSSRGQFAAHLGVSEGFLSLLLSGKRFAGLGMALRIEERTGGAVRASLLLNPSAKRDLATARLIRRGARGAARSVPDHSR